MPSAEESQWKKLSAGTIQHDGYMTVELPEAFDLPEGAGAILLALEGERLEIGTDENFTKGLHSAFDAIKDKGTSFILKDGAFIPAAKDMVRERLKYTEEPDLCLRAYTETR